MFLILAFFLPLARRKALILAFIQLSDVSKKVVIRAKEKKIRLAVHVCLSKTSMLKLRSIFLQWPKENLKSNVAFPCVQRLKNFKRGRETGKPFTDADGTLIFLNTYQRTTICYC